MSHASGRWIILVIVLSVVAGCGNVNVPLSDLRLPSERRATNHTRAAVFAELRDISEPPATQPDHFFPSPRQPMLPRDTDGCFVGLALSGGGSRSANFAAACMFQFQRLGLLQDVDYISAVSGGSLPAAYYCLNGRGWNPANVQQRLAHPFASDMIVQLLLPWNWLAMGFSNYDRSDLLTNSFRDVLFSRHGRALTYADLRSDRPRLLINATDLQTGRGFVFDNESFDQINSDLSRYPIAYAVTASSAVPVLLHPISLADYSTSFQRYIHLIDGGVAENLGILTLIETYRAQLDRARREGRPDPYPKGAVFVVVDAHGNYHANVERRPGVGWFEGLKTAMALTSAAMVNKVSSATLSDIIVQSMPQRTTVREVREYIDELRQRGYLHVRDRTNHEVRVIYVSLTQIRELRLPPSAGFEQDVTGISTYFNIDAADADRLYQAADLLIHQKFERRINEIVAYLNGGAASHPAAWRQE